MIQEVGYGVTRLFTAQVLKSQPSLRKGLGKSGSNSLGLALTMAEAQKEQSTRTICLCIHCMEPTSFSWDGEPDSPRGRIQPGMSIQK